MILLSFFVNMYFVECAVRAGGIHFLSLFSSLLNLGMIDSYCDKLLHIKL